LIAQHLNINEDCNSFVNNVLCRYAVKTGYR